MMCSYTSRLFRLPASNRFVTGRRCRSIRSRDNRGKGPKAVNIRSAVILERSAGSPPSAELDFVANDCGTVRILQAVVHELCH